MKKQKPRNKKILIAICSFLASLGLNIDLSVATPEILENFRIEGYPISRYQEINGSLSGAMVIISEFFASFSGNSILWLCIFAAMCMLFYHSVSIEDLRIRKYSAATAAVFSLFYVVGFSINKYNSLIAVTGSAISFTKCVIAFVGIGLIFYALLAIIFNWAVKLDLRVDKITKLPFLQANKTSFLICQAVIFICWVPYLIVYLPGFYPRDTTGQVLQALGGSALSNHHPIFTTGLFGLFMRLGMFLGSANTGVLLYSLFQMALVSAAYAYVVQFMAKRKVHKYIIIGSIIFFALYPVNAFYSMTMWKDTLFSATFMLLTLKIIDMISGPKDFFSSIGNQSAFALLCAALFLTRNNGLYILLIVILVLLIYFRKYWKNILAITCIFLIFFISTKSIGMALKIQKGSIAEALSLPIQQIARTVRAHGNEIDEEDRVLINAILPYEQLPELYNPILSDPVKGLFNESAFSENRSKYAGLIVRLSMRYPVTAVEAFLCQTNGYWYPDIDEWIVVRDIAKNDIGVHFEHIVPTFINNAFSGIFVFRVFPAVSMLVSIGFATWITIISGIILMLKKQYKFLLAFLLALLLWLTCLASPMSGMYRYIYGLFLVLPLLIALSLQSERFINDFLD